ncbi:MAG: hypothetical protein AABX50_02135 [Nanoarchaeota archaeon]
MPHYLYTQPQQPTNWPKIILIAIGIIILIGAGYLLINSYLSGKRGDNAGGNNIVDNNSAGSLGDNTYVCGSDSYNCGNFTTQAQAQMVFDYCEPTAGDIHGLDADGNGEACEGLT